MRFVGAAHPLHQEGLAAAAEHVGVDPAVLWSVLSVETAGCGFLADRRPTILFERHIFSNRTGRRFDAAHPGISGPAGGYGPPGAHQYERLEGAIACDRRAALESTSWGLGQIMGFNAGLAGFGVAEEMVSQMMHGENEQILGMASAHGQPVRSMRFGPPNSVQICRPAHSRRVQMGMIADVEIWAGRRRLAEELRGNIDDTEVYLEPINQAQVQLTNTELYDVNTRDSAWRCEFLSYDGNGVRLRIKNKIR
jgi:hypothetical protein